MKKILLLITVLALTIGATAQEKPFTYGIKAGLNISQLSAPTGQGIEASSMLVGFFASAHFNYSFGQFFGIQPELSFSMQGGGFDDEDNANVKYKFNYINIPVLFDVKAMENLSLFVGPQIGFNIYKGASFNGETISGDDFERVYTKITTVDIGAVVGLQYAILGKYLISARYNIGFTSTFDVDGGTANRVIQIGIGYQF